MDEIDTEISRELIEGIRLLLGKSETIRKTKQWEGLTSMNTGRPRQHASSYRLGHCSCPTQHLGLRIITG
jgi:hypothetical protein